MITVAYVAEEMGLPGHDSYENTLIMHHKDRFKKFAREYGITTPQSEYFFEEEDAVKWLDKAEYPIIVKPTDLSAGRGVAKADCYEEAKSAIKMLNTRELNILLLNLILMVHNTHVVLSFLIRRL